MGSLFTVTTTESKLQLKDRQGVATFTVSNTSGRPLRGRALLQSDDPTSEDWLSLEGDVERNFPVDGTEQYTVKLNVPENAPAGSYPFRLDMVNVERPDEDYTQGQTVTVEVPEAESEPKPFPVWIVLVGLGALLLGGLGVFLLWPEPGEDLVQVPNVAGDSLEGAFNKLTEHDLRWYDDYFEMQPHYDIPAFDVIGTIPSAGTSVPKGDSLRLILSQPSLPLEPTDPSDSFRVFENLPFNSDVRQDILDAIEQSQSLQDTTRSSPDTSESRP